MEELRAGGWSRTEGSFPPAKPGILGTQRQTFSAYVGPRGGEHVHPQNLQLCPAEGEGFWVGGPGVLEAQGGQLGTVLPGSPTPGMLAASWGLSYSDSGGVGRVGGCGSPREVDREASREDILSPRCQGRPSGPGPTTGRLGEETHAEEESETSLLLSLPRALPGVGQAGLLLFHLCPGAPRPFQSQLWHLAAQASTRAHLT